MKNTITLIFVALSAVLAGLLILAKDVDQNGTANILIVQQQSILEGQKRIEVRMAEDSFLKNLSERQGKVEARLALLEGSVKGIQSDVAKLERPAVVKKGSDGGKNSPPPPADPSKAYDIPVAHSPIIGNKNATVTIVEFVDFQCPFCSRFHQPIVEVLKAYPKDVRYVIKQFPLSFHKQANPASKAAFAAAEQGKYEEMITVLLQNGKTLNEEKFKELAGQIGLNVKKFMKDFKEKDAQWEKQIQADMNLGKSVGVRGTPSFYVNGRKTTSRDFGSFKREIDAILKKKK